MIYYRILLFFLFLTSAFCSSAQAPLLQWANRIGGVNSDVAYAMVIDASGNVYTTGSFSGTVDFDPGAGTYNLSATVSDVYVCKLNSSGAFVWAQQFDGAGFGVGNAIAVDASGNVYTTGYFQGALDFDPGVGVFNVASTGAYDVFVSKLNSSGAFVWAKNMGGSSYDISQGIAVDASGNVYTTGTFQGAGDYDPGAGIALLTPFGSADAFVSKLNSSGNFVWAKQFKASNTAVGNAITVDGTGNVHVAGYFSGTGDFDPGAGVYSFVSFGSTDIFVAKLNSSGAFVWADQMGGPQVDWSTAIVLDALGNVYTTGRFQEISDFDPGPGTYTLDAGMSYADVFVSKLNSSGALVWTKQIGGPNDEIAYSIALDTANNVYTAGYFAATADFDPGPGNYPLTSAGSNDIFISKLSNSGNFIWALRMGGIDADICQGVAVDVSDNVYSAGYFWDNTDFDPGLGTYTLTSAGISDIYVQKLCALPASPTNTTLIANQSICTGQSTTLSATGSGTLNWFTSPTGTTVIATGTSYITPTLTVGSYTYYVEASTCFPNPMRTAIVVTVNSLPVFSAGSNKPGGMCAGETATLTVTGVASATWFPGGPGTSIVVSPSVTTSYTVFGANGGCAIAAVIVQPIAPCPGIKELTIENSSLKIYPNPFNSKIVISNEGEFAAEIKIFNSLGSLIYSDKIAGAKMTNGNSAQTVKEINLAEQANGIYFVKVNQNKFVQTLKIVKE